MFDSLVFYMTNASKDWHHICAKILLLWGQRDVNANNPGSSCVESKPTLVAKQTQQRNQRHHQFTYFKCMYKKILTSPTYFCTNSEPITRMKQASVLFATARAQRVFPVPGGPKRRTPFGGSIPRLTNFSGYKQYHQTWVNYCFWAKSLPIRPRKISLQK